MASVKRANGHNIFKLLPSNEIQHLTSFDEVESIQNMKGGKRVKNKTKQNKQPKFLNPMHFYPDSYLFSSDKDHTSFYYPKQNNA